VIWCASHEELQRTHPRLPQTQGQFEFAADGTLRRADLGIGDEPIVCVDFTLEFDADGTLSRADVEIDSIAETFLMIGMEREARLAAGLMGEPARDVCQVLPHLISTLLESASA
jgi:hypothetical protein